MCKPHTVVKLTAVSFAVISFFSQGAAYQLREQSSSAAGNANAGRGAQITDASLIYSNPAAITELNGQNLTIGASKVTGSFDYYNAHATSTAGAPMSGADHGEVDINELIPHFFYSHQLNEQWHFGLGFFVPYGANTEYGDDFVGRNFAQDTHFTTYTIQPTIAYRVSDKLSLGLGLNLNYAEGELSKYKDHSGMCDLEDYLNDSYGMPVYQEAYCDSFYQVEGDDYGVGFTLGIHWRPTENTSIGINYLAEVEYNLKGDSTITNTPITGAFIDGDPNLLNVGDYIPAIDLTTGKLAVDPFKTEASKLTLVTPQSVTISLDHKLSELWSVQFSSVWTEWSEFENLIIKSDQASGKISRSTEQPQFLAVEGYIGYIPEYWENTWMYAVGVTYQASDDLTLKAGVSFDEDPTTDKYRTARIPANDNWYYALGANWQGGDDWSIDVAYNYIAMEEAHVEEYEYNGLNERLYSSAGSYAEYSADYDLTVHLFSVQFNHHF